MAYHGQTSLNAANTVAFGGTGFERASNFATIDGEVI